VTLCNIVGEYRRFGGTRHLLFHGQIKWVEYSGKREEAQDCSTETSVSTYNPTWCHRATLRYEHISSWIFRQERGGTGLFHRDVGIHLQSYMVSQSNTEVWTHIFMKIWKLFNIVLHLRFSQRLLRRGRTPGLWGRVVWIQPEISEEHKPPSSGLKCKRSNKANFWLTLQPWRWRRYILRNVGLSLNYMVLQPRKY
jgi:hypothetical protein